MDDDGFGKGYKKGSKKGKTGNVDGKNGKTGGKCQNQPLEPRSVWFPRRARDSVGKGNMADEKVADSVDQRDQAAAVVQLPQLALARSLDLAYLEPGSRRSIAMDIRHGSGVFGISI